MSNTVLNIFKLIVCVLNKVCYNNLLLQSHLFPFFVLRSYFLVVKN